MVNKNNRLERKWKIFLLLPLVFVSFCLFSCAVKSVPDLTHNEALEKSEATGVEVDANVEEMPISNGRATVIGYPSWPQGFSAGGYTLGEKYVIGYPTKPKMLLAPTADEVMLLIKD